MSGNAEVQRIVTFRLGRDLFAAPLERVERVLRHEAPRRVPGTPDWIEGVIDYAGRAVPLVDLRRRFGIQGASAAGQSRVLVLSAGEEWMAVVVDGVLDVRPIADGALEEPPAFFRGGAADAMRGMTRRGDDLVVVIDVDRLFAPAAASAEPARRDG